MRLIEMAGQRFGRLVVASKHPTPKMWLCRCDCGETALVTGANLRKGSTRSCGCLGLEWSRRLGSNRDFIAKRAEKKVVHGHKRRGLASPEYRTWLGMKRRCSDTKYKDYPNWGGRGIRVCKRWDESFAAFLADMGPRPTPLHSIDRWKTDLDYSPGNCRWATPEQQGGENKRTNIAVTVNGIAFDSLAAACHHFGVLVTTAHERIQAGIDPAVAVSITGRLPARRSRESYLRRGHR